MKKWFPVVASLSVALVFFGCAQEAEKETIVKTSQVFSISFQKNNLPDPSYDNCKDTYIKSGAFSGINYDGGSFNFVGNSLDSTVNRTFLYFGLENYIPYDAEIKSAYLYLSAGSGSLTVNTATVGVYDLSSHFIEATTTWNLRDTGIPWVTPGGDFASVSSALEITGGMEFFIIRLDPALIQSWIGHGSNDGMVIKAINEAPAVNAYKTFESTNTASRVLYYPKLVVYYTLPQ